MESVRVQSLSVRQYNLCNLILCSKSSFSENLASAQGQTLFGWEEAVVFQTKQFFIFRLKSLYLRLSLLNTIVNTIFSRT